MFRMEKYDAIMLYILCNCNEVEAYIKEFDEEMVYDNIDMNDEELACVTEQKFVDWFSIRMNSNGID